MIFIFQMNPWDVSSLDDFSYFCCPECIYRSSDACNFEDHAVTNHPLSKSFFHKDPLFITDETLNLKEEVNETFNNNSDSNTLDEVLEAESEVIEETPVNQISCSFCDQTFLSEKSMIHHRDTFHNEFPCEYCSKMFPSYKHLRIHVNDHLRTKCASCGKRIGRTKLEEHALECSFVNNPSSNSKLNCSSCDQSFSNEKLMIEHSFFCSTKYPTYKEFSKHVKKHFTQKQPKDQTQQEELNDNTEEIIETKEEIIQVIEENKEDLIETNQSNDQFGCPGCDAKFKNQTQISNHRTKTLHPWNCLECGKANDDYIELRGHMKDIHQKIPCNKCGVIFNLDLIKVHEVECIGTHATDGQQIWACETCGNTFNSSTNLGRHKINVHRKVNCGVCGQFYSSGCIRAHQKICGGTTNEGKSKAIKIIEESHQTEESVQIISTDTHRKHQESCEDTESIDKPYGCPCCNLKFKTQTHISNHRTKTPHNWNCEDCGQPSEDYLDFRKHLKDIHQKLPCIKCGAIFSLDLMKDHEMKCLDTPESTEDEQKNWICRHCGNAFSTKTKLGRHILGLHRKVPCNGCGQLYVHAGLRQHKKICLQISWDPSMGVNSKAKTEVSYNPPSLHQKETCIGCGNMFVSAELRKHRKICKPPPALKCEVCDEKFTSKSDLRQHRDSFHINLPCEECGKVFPTYAKLKSHSILHQKRPCEYCGKEISHAYYSQHIQVCQVDVNDKIHVCDKCPLKTHSIIQFKQHQRAFHSEKSNFVLEGTEIDEQGFVACPKCSSKFSMKGYVNHYRKVHGSYPPGYPTHTLLKCDQCPIELTTKKSLDRHILFAHNNEPRKLHVPPPKINCKHCGKLIRKNHMQLHIRKVHLQS